MLASVLKRGAYKFVFKLKCEVSWTCFSVKRDPKVCILKSKMTITFSTKRDLCVALLMKHDTHVCIEKLTSRYN